MSAGAARPLSLSAAATTIPDVVVERIRAGLAHGLESGIPFLNLPFSSPDIVALMRDVENRLRRILAVPDEYAVFFAQGGAYAHFALVALNLLADGQCGDYVESGLWAVRAAEEAAKMGPVSVIASGADDGYRSLPEPGRWRRSSNAAYCHVTSNESAHGLQFSDFPKGGEVPLVADMTGDFLTRPIDIGNFGLIYASAQKSLGAAGLTVLIARRDVLRSRAENIPAVFEYRRLAEMQSRVNTPPVMALYVADEMLRWMEDMGGLPELSHRRARRSRVLYELLDASPLLRCRAEPGHRSNVAICFEVVDPDRHAGILHAAAAEGLHYLDGHPAVGGFRLAVHNGHTDKDIERIVRFLESIK